MVPDTSELTSLAAGTALVYSGNKVATVSAELAAAFRPGDRVVVVADGTILHIGRAEHDLVDEAVGGAHRAFLELASCRDEQISEFYSRFADLLGDDVAFGHIAAANRLDVEAARARGRSTTRLALSDKMRVDMVAGLRLWRDAASTRDRVLEIVEHTGWRVEQRSAGVGVVGFVFEGRPNVFADATGVLRSGNTVVFRIGSDALGTARAIVEHALTPALQGAGLPEGAVGLLDSPERSTGWALFSHPQLSLAVARGSGEAVEQLGGVARMAGIPVSLHGTGGAWLIAGVGADAERFGAAAYHSLDRKVCNTLNVCVVPRERAADLVPVLLEQLTRAGERRGSEPKLHVAPGAEEFVPPGWFGVEVAIRRASGEILEPRAEPLALDRLGTEWEWEDSPEMTVAVADSLDQAMELFNELSPRLVASLVSDDSVEHDRFWAGVDAPFIGNGFTRWVDGQFALDRPELGLSNWQNGRLFGRSAVLSGDSVFTVRTRAVQTDPDLHR